MFNVRSSAVMEIHDRDTGCACVLCSSCPCPGADSAWSSVMLPAMYSTHATLPKQAHVTQLPRTRSCLGTKERKLAYHGCGLAVSVGLSTCCTRIHSAQARVLVCWSTLRVCTSPRKAGCGATGRVGVSRAVLVAAGARAVASVACLGEPGVVMRCFLATVGKQHHQSNQIFRFARLLFFFVGVSVTIQGKPKEGGMIRWGTKATNTGAAIHCVREDAGRSAYTKSYWLLVLPLKSSVEDVKHCPAYRRHTMLSAPVSTGSSKLVMWCSRSMKTSCLITTAALRGRHPEYGASSEPATRCDEGMD